MKMKKRVKLSIVTLLICSMISISLGRVTATETGTSSGEVRDYVVIARAGAIDDVISDDNLQEKEILFSSESLGNQQNEQVDVIEVELSNEQAAELATSEDVLVEQNIELTADSDETENESGEESVSDAEIEEAKKATWNLQMVGIEDAISEERKDSSQNVRVGVIDSGICYSSDMNIFGGEDFTADEENSNMFI